MLPLRLTVFAAVFGVALWGLFSLLENLREPELLRSTKAVLVKGCESTDSEVTAQRCPQLFCQKALLDARLFELKAKFEVTVDQTIAEQRLIGGLAQESPASSPSRFACVIEGGKVASAQAVDESALDILATQRGGWLAGPQAP